MNRRLSLAHDTDSGGEALSEVWAIPFLFVLVLFVAAMVLASVQPSSDLDEKLITENTRILQALESATDRADTAARQLDEAIDKIGSVEQQNRHLRGALNDASGRADDAEQRAHAAGQRAGEAERRAARAEHELATRSLEVVFVKDDSGSMRDENERLTEDQKLLFEALAPIAPLRVGLIAYLEDQRTLPIMRVRAAADDGGDSLGRLASFVDDYRGGGRVDLISAAESAVRMLDRSSQPASRQTIVILSDVSVYETRNETAAGQFIQTLSDWVRADERRAVLVVFTGEQPSDLAFYQRLEAAGGDQIALTTNISKLLPELLRAMTSR